MNKSVKKSFKVVLILFVLLIIIFNIWMFSDGFTSIPVKPYIIPTQKKYKSWNEVLSKPCPITIKAFKSGTISTDRYDFLNTKNPNIKYLDYRYKDDDVIFFTVAHKKFGDFLIDTGFNSSFTSKAQHGDLSNIMKIYYSILGSKKCLLYNDTHVKNVIKKYDLNPKKVYLSHLHSDHTAGLVELSDDIEIIFGKNEMSFMTKALVGKYFKNKKNIYTIDFNNSIHIPPFPKVIDLLGDGSFWALSTPGHSEDHISFLINSEAGPIFILADVCFYYKACEYDIEPVSLASLELSTINLKRLKLFMNKFPKTKIFVAHEY